MNEITSPEQYDLETTALKVPPHSIEAEQAVLGGLMLDNNAWERVSDSVSDGDFYRHDHRLIFRAIYKLAEANQPIDVVTLSEQLENEILDEAERKIFEIAEARPKTGGPVGISDILVKTIDRIDYLFNTTEALTGVSTGFTDLDEKTSGLQPADLIIVAGRPSMGKTTFAMNLVENAVMRTDKAVLVYSLEMPSDSIVMRMLSSLGRIDQTKVRSGKLDDEDWPRLTSAINLLNDKKLFIDDTAGISPSEMRARTRRLVREHGDLALIMIDYLQLMQIPGSSGDNRTNEISEISRSLKALAKEFNCPVIALSQLNRSLEQRPNKRPVNSDLRESGAIEQDADVIMFVYRDEVYHPETEFKGVAEIIIGKQRNGPIGTVRLAFIGKYTRFENLAAGMYNFEDE